MTRLVSLFGGTAIDTDVEVVKENQVIIPDYAQAVIIACEREDRSDVLTFFFHCLIFLMVMHSYLRIYLCTSIHSYLPEYLRTFLCTVVRRDVCWYENTLGCRCVGMLLHPYLCPFLPGSAHWFIRIVLPAYMGRYFRLFVPVSVHK